MNELKNIFFRRTPLIDVRAPVEFAVGSLPGAVNLPLMENEERASVGTVYKQQGFDAAVKLGHDLVSGEIKASRVQKWADFVRQNPEAVIYCFRGGLRSQISRQWLREFGIDRPLIEGGYKRSRQFLMAEIETFSEQRPLLILSGPTGSAKTKLLRDANTFLPILDLEALARHRGSAFGATLIAQPAQVDFENSLAVKLIELSDKDSKGRVLVEDESRLIGRCAIPEKLFHRMKHSEILYVDESFDQRVENIYQEYILNTALGGPQGEMGLKQFERYRRALLSIARKLGGLRTQEILADLAQAEILYKGNAQNLEANRVWIRKLLEYYYDPMYAQSFARNEQKILARGNAAAILKSLRSGCL